MVTWDDPRLVVSEFHNVDSPPGFTPPRQFLLKNTHSNKVLNKLTLAKDRLRLNQFGQDMKEVEEKGG